MATLTEKQKQEAEEAASAVISDVFGDIDNVSFPLDLNVVLDKYGIILKDGGFKDENISGAFRREDRTIFVSKSETPTRQKFTIAHEIGHFRLHKNRTTDILYRKQVLEFSDGLDEDETQANWFAANLLMPKEAVIRMFRISTNVRYLADIFGVSQAAMYFRLKDLGLLLK